MKRKFGLWALILTLGSALCGAIVFCLNNKLIIPTMLLAVQLALLIAPLCFRVASKRFDALEIGPAFALLYTLYSLPLAINLLYYSPTSDVSTVTLYLFETSLGLGAFWLGYLLKFNEQFVSRLPMLGKAIEGRLAISATLYGVIAFFLLYWLFEDIGGLRQYFATGYGGEIFLMMEGKGHLAVGFDLVTLAIGLLWYYNLTKKNLLGRIVLLVFSLVYIYRSIAMGDRGSLVALLVIGVTGYHYLVKKFSLRRSALLFLAGYLLALTLGAARLAVKREGLRNAPSYLVENLDPSYLLPVSSGELNSPAMALYDLIQSRETISYLYGGSYLIFLENLMPYVLVQERRPPLSQWYVQHFYPELWRIGGGTAFFTGAEAFLNFGFLGPLIQFFAYGLLLGHVYAYFRRQFLNPAAVFVYAVCLEWLFSFVRIDFSTALRGSLIRGIIPALGVAIFIVNGRFLPKTFLAPPATVRERGALRGPAASTVPPPRLG